MREIKFRAWDAEDNAMVFVDTLNFDSNGAYIDKVKTYPNSDIKHSWIGSSRSLMQYMGLKDKHGVEVYEGDIIRAKFIKDGSEATGWVEYFDKDASFICHLKGGDYALLIALSELEVIGDIYNSKELLKG